ncbi:unnamed protein product, partial [Ectocarpus sp. 12 AP-2014]
VREFCGECLLDTRHKLRRAYTIAVRREHQPAAAGRRSLLEPKVWLGRSPELRPSAAPAAAAAAAVHRTENSCTTCLDCARPQRWRATRSECGAWLGRRTGDCWRPAAATRLSESGANPRTAKTAGAARRC